MGKIKGWKKTLELPYRIDYNNTTGKYNKTLGMGEVAIIINKERDDFDWTVTLRKYVYPRGQVYKTLRIFKTKKEALDFALKYMQTKQTSKR